MTTDEQVRLARKFLSVLGRSDAEVIRSVVTDDIVWTYPGASRISGKARGVGEVTARAKQVAGYGVKVEIVRTLFGRRGVAFIQHNVGARDGIEFDEDLVAVFSFRDERISRLDVYLTDPAGADRFFT